MNFFAVSGKLDISGSFPENKIENHIIENDSTIRIPAVEKLTKET